MSQPFRRALAGVGLHEPAGEIHDPGEHRAIAVTELVQGQLDLRSIRERLVDHQPERVLSPRWGWGSMIRVLRRSKRASGRVRIPIPCPEGATGDSPGWNPGNHTPQRPPP